MKKVIVLLLSVVMVLAFCIPAFADDVVEDAANDPAPGSWKLDVVFDVSDTENPVFLDKEEHQSLYGSDLSILTFDDGGYASDITFEATGDMLDVEASWTVTEEGYEFAEEGMTLTFVYNTEKHNGVYICNRGCRLCPAVTNIRRG